MTKLFKNSYLFKSVIENALYITKISFVRNLRQPSLNKTNVIQDFIPYVPTEKVNQKILKVAIIGVPNAGKSTLINNLMDRKVCAASSKIHTTRSKVRAILTHEDSQIIFLDTPGLINDREQKKHKLENSFVKDVESSLNQADIIGVVHDVSNIYTRERLDIKVIKILEKYKNVTNFLILNKIDILKSKRKLLEITRLITGNNMKEKSVSDIEKNKTENVGWPHFKEVFMVSALTGNGLEDVKDYLITNAKPGKWMFPENVFTDQTPKQIIESCVKATLLDFLPQEIPYSLKPHIEFFETNDQGVISTVVLIECPTKRIATLIAGASDGRLRQITEAVQKDLQSVFQNFVRIKLQLQPKNK